MSAPAADADPPTAEVAGGPEAPGPEGDERLEKLDERIEALESRTELLEKENAELRAQRDAEQKAREEAEQAEAAARRMVPPPPQDTNHGYWDPKSRVRVGGYVDLGFFWVSGNNGSGVFVDYDHEYLPEYQGVVPDEWVFMGDAYSTAVNSRGEPADTGPSVAFQFDPIDNKGKASFIANAANMDLRANLGKDFYANVLVDFVPRNRRVFSMQAGEDFGLNDFVHVKRMYLRYTVPARSFNLDLYVGKVDSVFGREYRIQESPKRIGIVPSLLCRYSCGRPTGIRASWRFLPRRSLTWNMTITNGSSFQESFGHSNEIDTNDAKTAATRVAYRIPVGAEFEIGASGQVGKQDLDDNDGNTTWVAGADLHLDIRSFEFTAEFMQGKVPGRTGTEEGAFECGVATCLTFRGAYGQLAYRATNWLAPYVRVDWRDSEHLRGDEFVYLAKVVRTTIGVHFEVGEHVIMKAEYNLNGELAPLGSFDNDVFTTSLVGYF